MPLMHHPKTVSVLYSEPEVMLTIMVVGCFSATILSGQFHNDICRLRVEGSRVLIKDQKFDGVMVDIKRAIA